MRKNDLALKISPITFAEANKYVKEHHRHHPEVTGCKFCVSLRDESEAIHGVAICGRPVSRHLDDGYTLEINRLCTDGTQNACSMLYGACCRIAKEMGYGSVITYILQSENGSSLKASNFACEGEAGGKVWTGKRNHDNGVPAEMKTRWRYNIHA